MFRWPWQSRQDEAKRPARSYAAAQLNRYVDFMTSLEVAHKERLRDLPKLRAHSRDLSKNNVYAARYQGMVSTHLVGPDGIGFESEILDKDGKPREDWNDYLESSFAEWGKACSADGRQNWVDSQHLAAESTATDGEHLVHLIRGFPNKWGFAIEPIDADRLDHTYNAQFKGGRRIVGGVEMDVWGRRLAYHLWTAHPSDYEAAPVRTRIPADQILHLYREDRVQGVRGVPWGTPCMVQVNMLGRLWTSELAAANHESDRLGIIKNQAGIDGVSDGADCQTTAEEITSDHATFLGLDAGQDIVFPTIQHPNGILPQFTAYLLKGVASGYGVSYHSLAGDVSDANYSSARVALLEERDNWRKLQGWFVRSYCDPIYRVWLEMAVLSGAVSLPVLDADRLCVPRWAARSWDWVDPEKDIKASILAIENNLSTHQRELAQQGLDWRDVFQQNTTETEYLAELRPVEAVPEEGAAAVQDTALNGAQVASLLEILNAVTSGSLPKATAIAMILAAFPAIDEAQVSAMVNPIVEGSAKPEPVEPIVPKADEPPARNAEMDALNSRIDGLGKDLPPITLNVLPGKPRLVQFLRDADGHLTGAQVTENEESK